MGSCPPSFPFTPGALTAGAEAWDSPELESELAESLELEHPTIANSVNKLQH
jgi:hypothetical protein